MGCFGIYFRQGRKSYKLGEAAYDECNRDQGPNIGYLKQCVSHFEDALEHYPKEHYKYPFMHIAIANAKWKLYEESGEDDLNALNSIIEHATTAYQTYSREGRKDASFYTTCLSLGTYLRHRFRLTRIEVDGTRAMSYHIQAATLDRPEPEGIPPHFAKSSLIELGVTQWTFCDVLRFQSLSSDLSSKLEQGISSLEKAARRANPAHLDSSDAICLLNLGHALALKHRMYPGVSKDDIGRAVTYFESALSIPAIRDNDKMSTLLGLSRALAERNQAGDLKAAIEHTDEALALMRIQGERKRNRVVENETRLALARYWVSLCAASDDIDDVRKSAKACEEVFNTQNPSPSWIVFNLAILWGSIVNEAKGSHRRVSRGDVEKAREFLDKALKTFAGDEGSMKVLNDIQGGRKPSRTSSLKVPDIKDGIPQRRFTAEAPLSEDVREDEAILGAGDSSGVPMEFGNAPRQLYVEPEGMAGH